MKKNGETSEEPKVIFVCEHGAAKSIIAAAYFNKMAQEKGVHQRAIARGINPDAELSSRAISGLLEDGLTPTEPVPRRLSPEELQEVQQVVTFCKIPGNYRYNKAVEYWDNVPPVSENYVRARDAILVGIKHLLDRD